MSDGVSILIDGELALELHVIPTAGHVVSLSVSVDHARITSFYCTARHENGLLVSHSHSFLLTISVLRSSQGYERNSGPQFQPCFIPHQTLGVSDRGFFSLCATTKVG
jgi:hypothetical protein